MRRVVAVSAALALVSASCVSPVFTRVATAPKLPPSENVVVVERPPSGGVLLGTAEVQLTANERAEDCVAIALRESKQVGATHVVMPPATPGDASHGPHCTAQAYYVAPKR